MIELRLNVCAASINIDKCEWTKCPIKPNDSSFGSRAKSNMCCIQEISDPADYFVGGGSERTKSGNEKTSQKATTVFHRRDDGVLI